MVRKRKRTPTRLLPMAHHHTRPCEVNGRPALFHRWVEDPALEALVEYRDGTVHLVKPELVSFGLVETEGVPVLVKKKLNIKGD